MGVGLKYSLWGGLKGSLGSRIRGGLKGSFKEKVLGDILGGDFGR